ncbi:MAG: hypothetical protein LLG37_08335 [Spirochaetia bacterium]|nr:hypothetical protein [Spirochaetia bacterium]
MKKVFLILAAVMAMALPAFAGQVDIDHFLILPSISGVSGFISNPSACVSPAGRFSLGVHNFLFKADYGIMDRVEAGIAIDFGATNGFTEIIKATDINLKGIILKEDDMFLNLAAGIERFPINVFDDLTDGGLKIYAVASKKVLDMDVSAGVKKKLGVNSIGISDWDFMFDLSKVINDTMLAVLEYDEKQFNAGVKISFNYNLCVDFFVVGLNNLGRADGIGGFLRDYFVFGITYLQ